MANTTTAGIFDSRYFQLGNFRNVIHACNLTIIDHFADQLFGGDADRIIYSTSDYAFRRRIEMQSGEDRYHSNNLNLPFMNFSVAPNGIENGGDRRWWNHSLNYDGIYIPELGRKMRMNPIQIQYDSTLYVKEEIDAMFAFSNILWDDSNETILKPSLTIDGFDVENIGVLGYNISYNTQYNESDWLERNKIRALELDMSLQTWMIQDKTEGFGISKKFILNLEQKHPHTNNTYLQEIFEYVAGADDEPVET